MFPFVLVALAIPQKGIYLLDSHLLLKIFSQEVSQPSDEGREAQGVGRQEVVDVGHFPRGDEESISKNIRLAADLIEEVFRESIFFVGGEDDKLELVEGVDSFSLGEDLHLEFVEQLVGRVVLHPQERMRNIHEKQSSYLLHNVLKQQVIVFTNQVHQC